jgi:hypothetical protein
MHKVPGSIATIDKTFAHVIRLQKFQRLSFWYFRVVPALKWEVLCLFSPIWWGTYTTHDNLVRCVHTWSMSTKPFTLPWQHRFISSIDGRWTIFRHTFSILSFNQPKKILGNKFTPWAVWLIPRVNFVYKGYCFSLRSCSCLPLSRSKLNRSSFDFSWNT